MHFAGRARQRRFDARRQHDTLDEIGGMRREERGELVVAEDQAAVVADQRDAFVQPVERVRQAALRRAARGALAFHHGTDVVAHRRHGREQPAQLVAAGRLDLDVQFAGGDAAGGAGTSAIGFST